jgi:transaldolase
LLFSTAQYLAAAEAFIRGLERRAAAALPLQVASVASLFVSRWDSAVNPSLPAHLRSELGIAMMGRTYAAYRALLVCDRWRRLEQVGALAQRVLWASTSAKEPGLLATHYVDRLAAAATIDTMSEPTLLEFARNGCVQRTLDRDASPGDAIVGLVADMGIDLDLLADDLQARGVDSFGSSWSALLATIDARLNERATAAPSSRS